MAASLLQGVIDIHAHTGPDCISRSLDALDLARLAKDQGMSAIVLKNHFEGTASLAYMVRKALPGIQVFGGITLNLTAGGMNASAVDYMARVSGGWGRFVWMGSVDTESQVQFDRTERSFVSVSRAGKLLPEVTEVLDVIARHKLVLATGHSTAEEDLLLVEEARRRGIMSIVVTHAMMAPTHMPLPDMQRAVRMGAYIEFVYNGLIGPHKEFEMSDYAGAIREVGAGRCVLASDLGQAVNPPHTEGLIAFFAGLRKEGLSADEIDCMSKVNPARLLSLD